MNVKWAKALGDATIIQRKVAKMKKHSPDEIRDLLLQADTLTKRGLPQADICSDLGISVMTYHRWRKMAAQHDELSSNQEHEFELHAGSDHEFGRRFAGFTSVTDLQRLRALQFENLQLRKIIADLMLERLQMQEGAVRPNGRHSATPKSAA